MRRIGKKVLSLALALVMAVTVLPTAGSARQIAGTEQAAQTAESLTQAGEQTTVTEVVPFGKKM